MIFKFLICIIAATTLAIATTHALGITDPGISFLIGLAYGIPAGMIAAVWSS